MFHLNLYLPTTQIFYPGLDTFARIRLLDMFQRLVQNHVARRVGRL